MHFVFILILRLFRNNRNIRWHRGLRMGNWNGNMGIRIEIGTLVSWCLGLGLRHFMSLPAMGVLFVGRMIRLSSSQILSSLSAVLVSSLFVFPCMCYIIAIYSEFYITQRGVYFMYFVITHITYTQRIIYLTSFS